MVQSASILRGTPAAYAYQSSPWKDGGNIDFKTSTGNKCFTFTQNKYRWRQQGDSVDVSIKATLTSAWTGSGTQLELEIPTADFAFPAGLEMIEGSIRIYDGSSFTTLGYVSVTLAGNRIRFHPMQQTDGAQTNVVRNQNDYAVTTPVTWASGMVIWLSIRGLETSSFAGQGQAPTLNMNATSPVPAGTVTPYAGSVLPLGHQWAQGAEVSKTTYAQAYINIGDTYATQINPTTGAAWAAPAVGNFRLPDMRAVSPRGVGTPLVGSAVTLGGYQDDQLQGHWHVINDWGFNRGIQSDSLAAAGGASQGITRSGTASTSDGQFAARTISSDNINSYGTPRVGLETRGKNRGLNFIVKMFNESWDAGPSFPESSSTALGFVQGGRLPAAPGLATIAAGRAGETKYARLASDYALTTTMANVGLALLLDEGVWEVETGGNSFLTTSYTGNPDNANTSGNLHDGTSYLLPVDVGMAQNSYSVNQFATDSGSYSMSVEVVIAPGTTKTINARINYVVNGRVFYTGVLQRGAWMKATRK